MRCEANRATIIISIIMDTTTTTTATATATAAAAAAALEAHKDWYYFTPQHRQGIVARLAAEKKVHAQIVSDLAYNMSAEGKWPCVEAGSAGYNEAYEGLLREVVDGYCCCTTTTTTTTEADAKRCALMRRIVVVVVAVAACAPAAAEEEAVVVVDCCAAACAPLPKKRKAAKMF